MNRFWVLVVFTLFLTYSCRYPDKAYTKTISIDIDKQDEISDFIDSYNYICLETTSENLIDEISKIQLDSTFIYICDKKQHKIFIFDGKGEYYGSTDKQGQAADEYLDIDDFNVYKSKIYCLSNANKKIYCYDNRANMMKEIKLDNWFHNFHLLNDSLMFLYAENSNDGHYNYILYNYHKERVVNRFDEFDKNI